jgi:hypothetical protein
MRTVMPLVLDRRTQALVVLAALVASLLLGPGEAAAWPKGPH